MKNASHPVRIRHALSNNFNRIRRALSNNFNRIRRALSLLGMVLVCVSAFSQPFYGGLAIGGVTSQLDGDNNNGFHKAGFTAGAFVGLELSDFVDLQLEIKYIQKGSSSSVDDPDNFSINLDYVEVPLVASGNLGFFVINGKKLNWISLEAGVSLDVLAHVKYKYNGVNEMSTNQWKRLCFNGILGVKFNVARQIQIGARVITSITSVYTGNYLRALRFGHWGAYNDVLELVLYYRFK